MLAIESAICGLRPKSDGEARMSSDTPPARRSEPSKVPSEARAAAAEVRAEAEARVQAEKAQLAKLVAHAVSKKFHPVIVFGGTASGKTAVIMSLLRLLLMRPNGVGIELDGTFFASDYPNRSSRITDARTYLESTFEAFKTGEIRKSELERPLFLPIRITTDQPVKELNDHIRIVIVDGMGEWFEADVSKRGSDGSWTRDFQPEVSAFIGSQQVESLTTIFVAPHSTDEDNSVPSNKVVAGLSSIITKYRTQRTNESSDWNLFLFTKWDLTSRARWEETIWWPDLARLDVELQTRAGEAWATYYNGTMMDHDRRCFMQYVSMIGDTAVSRMALPPVGSPNEQILDHYSKILLNWIYGNAAEATCDVRLSLFPDVDVFRTQKMPFYDRVLGWIAGARL